MKRVLGVLIAGMLGVSVTAGVGRATTPGPGQPFDCSAGGDSSCATDDPGCVSNQKGHLGCSIKLGSAFAKAISATIVCHIDRAEMRLKGTSENGAAQSEENCEGRP